MAENETKKPSVRKLTVDNFSVIKHAELEFGKITVLIGPQASGKSLLCKLAYFLGKQSIDLALAAILEGQSIEKHKMHLIREFAARFPLKTWQNQRTLMEYESSTYSLLFTVNSKPEETNFEISFSDEFENLFQRLSALVREFADSGADSRRFLVEQVRTQIHLLLNQGYLDDSVYIPDGRSFFVNPSMGFNALASQNVDPIVRDFSLELRLGAPWNPNPIAGEHVLRVLDEIRRDMIRIAGGYVEGRDSSLMFRRLLDSREIPLTFLSSGEQELLPLFNVLGQMAARQRDRVVLPRKGNLPGMPNEIIVSKGRVFLEEPEANVFPSTQYELVKLITRLAGEPQLDFSWVITTHSPYILSSFNNLIEAGQAARNNPQIKDGVAKIVPEQYWIKEGDFRAYAIEDGNLRSILNESGFVEGNYLDQVSETIGDEFDRLIKLEYDHAKAS